MIFFLRFAAHRGSAASAACREPTSSAAYFAAFFGFGWAIAASAFAYSKGL